MKRHGSAIETVPATPDEVFDLITNVDRLPEWNAHLPKVVQSALLSEEGDEWVVEIHAMGGHWNSRSTVIERDPATHRFVHRSRSDDGNPSYAIWTWELTPVDEGTRISVHWSLNPKTFWRKALFARIRHRQLRREVATSLRALQSMVRSPA